MTDLVQRLGPAILSRAPIHVAVVDRQQRLVWHNDRFREVFEPQEAAPCWEVLKGASQRCERCLVMETFGDGAPRSSRELAVAGNGDELVLDVECVPLVGDDGAVEFVALTAVDATRLHQLEGELKQSDRLATVGLTAAGLAHTIKNIIGGMEGAIYTVDSGLKQDDRDRLDSGWEMVKGYIEQVNALVWNLLNFTRDEEPHLVQADPGELVREVVRLFAGKGGLVGIELEAEVGEDLPVVSVDPQVMHACLSNLVTNSMDACMWDPDGDKEHRIVLSVHRGAGDGAVFQVTDNGMGISEENQKKVLGAFFTTKGIRGTGLGLLLTRKAVTLHGGTISFTSTPGQGSTFRVELPAATADQPATSSPRT